MFGDPHHGNSSECQSGGFESRMEDCFNVLRRERNWSTALRDPAVGRFAIRNITYVKEVWTAMRMAESINAVRDVDLRHWQRNLLNRLGWSWDSEPPTIPACEDRLVWFVCGLQGNEGKSTFIRGLVKRYGGESVWFAGNDKLADWRHSFTRASYSAAVFDISRFQRWEHLEHLAVFAEEIKSGLVHSGKYQSCAQITRIVHMIIMCNSLPTLKGSEAWWNLDRTGGSEVTQPNELSTVMLLKNGVNKWLTNREVYLKLY